jgi:hypothetical protein
VRFSFKENRMQFIGATDFLWRPVALRPGFLLRNRSYRDTQVLKIETWATHLKSGGYSLFFDRAYPDFLLRGTPQDQGAVSRKRKPLEVTQRHSSQQEIRGSVVWRVCPERSRMGTCCFSAELSGCQSSWERVVKFPKRPPACSVLEIRSGYESYGTVRIFFCNGLGTIARVLSFVCFKPLRSCRGGLAAVLPFSRIYPSTIADHCRANDPGWPGIAGAF